MSHRTSNPAYREELLARCRREREELRAMRSAAVSRLHLRDYVRALRMARRLLRMFGSR